MASNIDKQKGIDRNYQPEDKYWNELKDVNQTEAETRLWLKEK